MKNPLKKFKTYFIIAIGFLLLALLPWPYFYYQILKWVVAIGSAYIAFNLYEHKQYRKDVFILGGIALLFNPIWPIYLTREIWSVIDIVVAIYFVVKLKKKHN
jgi:hypothetical protein